MARLKRFIPVTIAKLDELIQLWYKPRQSAFRDYYSPAAKEALKREFEWIEKLRTNRLQSKT